MKRILVFTVLSLATSLCRADDVVFMPGPAVYMCTQWLAAKDGPLRLPLIMWVFGFVSGSNFRTAQDNSQAKVVDNDVALAFADKYCQDNPNHALSQLSLALVEQFGGPKSRHEWTR